MRDNRICWECDGEGFVQTDAGEVDACGRCMRASEARFGSRRRRAEHLVSGKTPIMEGREHMDGLEQAGPDGAGTVTAAAILVADQMTLELVVYPALLRAMPWFRGGRDVSVVRGMGPTAGVLRVMHPGPHRLLARVTNRLDKLPPVVLRVPRLEHLQPRKQSPVPVQHRVLSGLLEITLPEWARPPVPFTAPVTSFGSVLAGGVR